MEMHMALVSCLQEVPDPRSGNRMQYDLTEMLVVAICALLSGAEDVTEDCTDLASAKRSTSALSKLRHMSTPLTRPCWNAAPAG